jgi:hypothetical protein
MATTFSKTLAATFLVVAGMLGSAAVANAVPEWDIERYDDCMKGTDLDDPSEQLAWTRKCCLDSGGVWNESLGKCQAPPANSAQHPGRVTLPGVLTPVSEPTPILSHPGLITQTFEPDNAE